MLNFFNNVIINGNATIAHIYNKSETDNLLNNKQDKLTDRGGEGAVLRQRGAAQALRRQEARRRGRGMHSFSSDARAHRVLAPADRVQRRGPGEVCWTLDDI